MNEKDVKLRAGWRKEVEEAIAQNKNLQELMEHIGNMESIVAVVLEVTKLQKEKYEDAVLDAELAAGQGKQ